MVPDPDPCALLAPRAAPDREVSGSRRRRLPWSGSSVVRATGPTTTFTFTFGRAGDRPVTGDWDGDGVTDIGVVRGAEWLLAKVPTDGGDPVVWREVTLTDPSDPTGVNGVPVTGDWNGDGADGIGVFRRGRWTLADPVPDPAAP